MTVPGRGGLATPTPGAAGGTTATGQQQNQIPLAEATMSPRQRVAIIPTITRITSVPADDKDHPVSEVLPDLDQEDIDQVRGWIDKDRQYEGEYRKMKKAMNDELAEALSASANILPGGQAPSTVTTARKARWFEKDIREDSKRDGRQQHYMLLWPHKKRSEKEARFKRISRKPVFL
jgi:hypothetical protein